MTLTVWSDLVRSFVYFLYQNGMVFSWLDLGWWVLRRKITGVRCYFHHISRVLAINMWCITLMLTLNTSEECFPGCSSVKVFFSVLPGKKVTYSGAWHSCGWGSCCSLLLKSDLIFFLSFLDCWVVERTSISHLHHATPNSDKIPKWDKGWIRCL